MLLNVITLPVVFILYFKRPFSEKQQKSMWLLLSTLAVSDTVEIIFYLTTYSLLYLLPDSGYIRDFFIPNKIWYVQQNPLHGVDATHIYWLINGGFKRMNSLFFFMEIFARIFVVFCDLGNLCNPKSCH